MTRSLLKGNIALVFFMYHYPGEKLKYKNLKMKQAIRKQDIIHLKSRN